MPSFSKIKRKILIAGEISLDVSSHACNLEFDKLSSFRSYKIQRDGMPLFKLFSQIKRW